MDKLHKLDQAIKTARMKMRMALERKWRTGERVRFMLKHGQINPSEGVVVGHSGDGTIAIEMRTGTTKHVHFTDMYYPF